MRGYCEADLAGMTMECMSQFPSAAHDATCITDDDILLTFTAPAGLPTCVHSCWMANSPTSPTDETAIASGAWLPEGAHLAPNFCEDLNNMFLSGCAAGCNVTEKRLAVARARIVGRLDSCRCAVRDINVRANVSSGSSGSCPDFYSMYISSVSDSSGAYREMVERSVHEALGIVVASVVLCIAIILWKRPRQWILLQLNGPEDTSLDPSVESSAAAAAQVHPTAVPSLSSFTAQPVVIGVEQGTEASHNHIAQC